MQVRQSLTCYVRRFNMVTIDIQASTLTIEMSGKIHDHRAVCLFSVKRSSAAFFESVHCEILNDADTCSHFSNSSFFVQDAFTGCQILPCSHKVHKECATQMIRSGM